MSVFIVWNFKTGLVKVISRSKSDPSKIQGIKSKRKAAMPFNAVYLYVNLINNDQ